MASRTFLLLGLLLAIVVLITSEVSAIDLAENHEKETKEAVGEFDAKHPDGRGGYNRGYGGGRGGGRDGGGRGGGGHYGGGGGGGRRGRSCYHGCCRRGSYGCVRCCSYAGEAVEADQP